MGLQGVQNKKKGGTSMEKDIENLKIEIKKFIEKYKIKTFKVNTKVGYHSRLNTENPEKWITEYYSKVEKIDINLTK